MVFQANHGKNVSGTIPLVLPQGVCEWHLPLLPWALSSCVVVRVCRFSKSRSRQRSVRSSSMQSKRASSKNFRAESSTAATSGSMPRLWGSPRSVCSIHMRVTRPINSRRSKPPPFSRRVLPVCAGLRLFLLRLSGRRNRRRRDLRNVEQFRRLRPDLCQGIAEHGIAERACGSYHPRARRS